MNVAIVMPYHNDERNLHKSVMGILGQSYLYWTLFLIDDGSDRKAKNILGNHISSRIKIIEKENGGVSSARNVALDLIRKDTFYSYVAYCDSDDIWDEHYLTSQIDTLKDCDFVYSSVREEFEDGSKAYPFGIPNPYEYPGIEFMLKTPFIYISSVVHKTQCLSVGNFDDKLNSIEDWDMWIRIAKANYNIKKNRSTCITYTAKQNQGMASKRTPEIDVIFKKKHGIL